MDESPTAEAARDGAGTPDPALLQAMIDAIPARAAFLDAGHRYRYVNRAFVAFAGCPEAAILGRSVAEILGAEAAAHYRALADHVAAGEDARWEGWSPEPGGPRYMQETLKPYRSADGALRGLIAFARDLTELKQREQELAGKLEALAASEALHAAVVSSGLDCIVVIDEAGCVVEFNPAAEATFGRTREAVLGQPIGDLIVPPSLRQRHADGLARYLRTGQGTVLGRRIEVEALRADGSVFPVELAITEVRLTGRRLFTAHLRDLTAARAAAGEIESQRARIHQIEKLSAMGSLLAGVAHELNNPLAVLVAQATLLKDKAPTEDVRRRAERIHAAAERSGRIVKSFIAMARQKPPQREPADLNAVVRAAVEMTAYGRRSAGIEIEIALSDALPIVSADRDLVGQVVANLLLNAQQVLLDQAPPRRIWIATAAHRDGVALTVADNGPGVPAAIAERVFEPYFTTKPVGAGTGIGLSISRNVVEAHGGRIELGTRPGGGALFRVVLPADAVQPGPDPEEPLRRGSGRAILVVDDEADVAQSLAEMLQDLGHAVQVLDSGAAALDALGRTRFDLVFADLRMPGLNGIELRERIRARDPALAARTVIVTGDTVAGTSAVARAAPGGEAVLLEKPFTADDVRAALDRALAPAAAPEA